MLSARLRQWHRYHVNVLLLTFSRPQCSHKTLRGPRAGMIFFRKDKEADLEKRINDAVFPACQGGPHNNVSPVVSVHVLELTCHRPIDHRRHRYRP